MRATFQIHKVSIHISDCSEMKLSKLENNKTLPMRFNPHLWLLRDEIFLQWGRNGRLSVSIHISDCSEMKFLRSNNVLKHTGFQSTSLIAQRWNSRIWFRNVIPEFQSTSLIAQRWNVNDFGGIATFTSFNPHLWLLRDEIYFSEIKRVLRDVSIHISDCSEMKSESLIKTFFS